MLRFKPTFSLSSFTFIKRPFRFFAVCHKGAVICISEVIAISPGNLDSRLCFFQPSTSHDVISLVLHKKLCQATPHWKDIGYLIHMVFIYVSAQSCPAVCDPMDCSPPGSSVHGIFQAGILEWVTISSFKGSSRPTD